MPPSKKIDLLPDRLRSDLKAFLKDNAFGRIEEATDLLNEWLAEEGEAMTVGKTAVGNYSQVLKDQQRAYEIADELTALGGIEEEAGMHKAIMHMIAAQCVDLMVSTREAGGNIDAKSLAALGKMLKDLMSSAGMREKLIAKERERIREEAREQAAAEAELAAKEAGMDDAQAAAIKGALLDKEAAQRAREILGFD